MGRSLERQILVAGLIVLAAGVLTLGIWGYARAGVSGADAVYDTLNLFGFDYISPHGSIGWQLQTARFGGVAFAGSALLAAATRLFRDQWDLLRVAIRPRHIIVVGLGAKAMALIDSATDATNSLVVIESDRTSPNIKTVRSRRIPVVIGDARQSATLVGAGIGRAKHLVCLLTDSQSNLEVALAATEGISSPELVRLVHTAPLRLTYELREAFLNMQSIDAINEVENTAQWLLNRCHPATQPTPLTLLGLDDLAEALVVEYAKRSKQNLDVPIYRDVTVVGPSADRWLAQVSKRWYYVRQAVEVERIKAEVLDNIEDTHPLLVSEQGTVFVSASQLDVGLAIARNQRKNAKNGSQVLLSATDSGHLNELLKREGIEVVDPRSVGLDIDIVLYDIFEALARAIHEGYLDDRRNDHTYDPTLPAMKAWGDLEEQYREPNRSQAQSLVNSCAKLGLSIRRSRLADGLDKGSSDAPAEQLTIREVECLAKQEHERWCKGRSQDGWRWGETRNNSQKTHPDLLPWEDLPDSSKEKNREIVQRWPELLESLGYKFVRSNVE
jgi:Trk K+ transport system NAD-binding subunit